MATISSTTEFIAVTVSAPSVEVAQTLATLLVKEKLAACVQITPQITSTYTWEGKIETSNETLLVAKTKSTLLDSIITTVKSAHPYDTPEIIATPIVGGYDRYLNWIRDNTQ